MVADTASTDDLHAELRRLHLAQRDLTSAEAMLSLPESRPNYHGSQFGPVEEGLWTGVAVSYMRRFTKSPLRIAETWEVFDNRTDLLDRHDQLRKLRDKLFAHTDPTSGREILLVPLVDKGGGFVTEQRPTFRYSAIEDVRELFQFHGTGSENAWTNSSAS